NDLRIVSCGAETQHRLVALGDFRQHAGGGVEAPEVGPAFASEKLQDALAIRAPYWWIVASGARRRLVTKDALSDIVVELCSEVSWLRILCYVEHPQVRLGMGIHRLVLGSDKSDLLAVGAEREPL